MFASTSFYLFFRTSRNRVVSMTRKLRQPKYLIGLALTVGYFWMIFFANPAFRRTTDPEASRASGTLIVAGFYFVQVLFSWFALGTGRGVAFREAEVQLLFPRPLTRWQILVLKWLQAQFAALIGGLLIGVMFQRFGSFSYPYVVAGFLLNQSVFHANATLFGLWLARLKVRGGLGAKFVRVPAWTLLFALGVAVAFGWRHLGGVSGFSDVKLLFETPWMHAVLLPFTALADVMAMTDPSTFAIAALYPLALIAVQGFLVWRLDFRFEDQAVEIAEKIQNVRADGIGALRDKKELVIQKPGSPWELAPIGPPWRALVWKNLISVGRFPRLAWIRIFIIVIVMGAVFSDVLIEEGDAATRIGFLLLGLMAYASILAPTLVRVDLRIDIPHFDVLKAMPIRGRALIFGEIMGTVVALFVLQLIGCLIAAFLITRKGDYVFTWPRKIPAFIALASAFFALDFAWVTAENLMALWFPGFVRLGRGVRAGFDQIGQNMMGAMIRMLGLLVLFVIPAIAGAVLGAVIRALGVDDIVAISIGVVLGSILIVAEAYLMIHLSDARYERFDITSENATESE